jgi:hypothetical protein
MHEERRKAWLGDQRVRIYSHTLAFPYYRQLRKNKIDKRGLFRASDLFVNFVLKN